MSEQTRKKIPVDSREWIQMDAERVPREESSVKRAKTRDVEERVWRYDSGLTGQMRTVCVYRGVRAAAAAAPPLWDLQSFLVSDGLRLSGRRQNWGAIGKSAVVSVARSGPENSSRFFATAESSQLRAQLRGEDHPSGLLHVLRCEIEDLRAKAKAIAARSPPNPWKLVKDESGELELALKRKYGLEDIILSCIFQLVPKGYQRNPVQGEDPETRLQMLQLTISITKGAEHPVLKLLCECYRDGFAVHQVDVKGDSSDENVYRPYFSESKPGLVDEVQIFLYERGLNGTLASYLHNALEFKRLLKSLEMLEKIESFIK